MNEEKKQVCELVERAQRMLEEAARTACPLHGWSDQWEDIGRTVDQVEALWWRLHHAAPPTGKDAQ